MVYNEKDMLTTFHHKWIQNLADTKNIIQKQKKHLIEELHREILL